MSGAPVSAPTRVAFRGGGLVVADVGAGDPVGYLHGFVGSPPGQPFPAALADHGRRVIAPSLPGFTGSSERPEVRSLHDWIVATSEVLDVAGLTGGPVVASSIGAMLALEVACVRPEAFSALVLIAPLGLFDVDDPVADPFATTLSGQRALLTADPAVTAAFYDDDPSLDAAAIVERGVERYLTRMSAASLVWPIPEFGLSTRLHRVACPVTLVWGAADRLNPVSYAERWRAALPGDVEVHVVDGAGHLAEWDRPAEVAAIAAASLRR